MECQILFDGNSRSSLSRKSLFPCEKIDSDDSDVGHMSPLNSSTTNSSDSEDPPCNDVHFKHNKLDDYIIYDNKYVDANSSVIQAKSTPKMCRVPCSSETMSPLLLSPLQSLISSPILYSPNTDGIVPISTTLDLSPSEKMKTPHDTSIVLNKAPKLIRKSFIDTSQNSECDLNDALSDSITDSTLNKSNRLDSSLTKSKVRTALFPESDICDISLSVKSFYPKDNKYERFVCESVVVNKKPKQKQAPTFICNRKRTAGLINAGVRHKIKKPKKKPSQDKLLQAAMEIIKNSPLNEYFNKENRVNSAGNKIIERVNKYALDFNERKIKPLKEQTKSILLDNEIEQEKFVMFEERSLRKRLLDSDGGEQKKFFKSSQPRGVITVNKNIKIGVDNGQFELLDGPKVKRRKFNIIQSGLDNETETLENISNSNISAILKTLDGVSALTNCDKEVSAAEKANILLSPTSQMCDMASGLALNSPKRAKLNINEILTSPNPNTNTQVSSPTIHNNEPKLFPVFNNNASDHNENKNPSHSKKSDTNAKSKRFKALSPTQMLLDVGQKHFGVTQCGECQFVYHMGDPGEELMHNNHHNAGSVLRFNGWKHEHVVAENIDSRIIRVTIHDSKIWWKKVRDLMVVISRNLGSFDLNCNMDRYVVYLYIRQRSISGCIVSEPKQQAHRFLPAPLEGGGVDLCSEETYPVRCGIIRVWTAPNHRRAGIATALMDALRGNFAYGEILRLEDIAISSPTDAGKQFAYTYFGNQNFLIYS